MSHYGVANFTILSPKTDKLYMKQNKINFWRLSLKLARSFANLNCGFEAPQSCCEEYNNNVRKNE